MEINMRLISHPSEGNLPEKNLFEHLLNVAEASSAEVRRHRLNLSQIDKNDLERLSFLIGILHDFGKSTSFFQRHVRGKTVPSNLSAHSLLSAVVCYHIVKNEFASEKWAYVAFHVIYKHHGNLSSFDLSNSDISFGVFKDQIDNIVSNYIEELVAFYGKYNIDIHCIVGLKPDELKNFLDYSDDFVYELADDRETAIELFFIINYLFSLLTDNDKKDAARLTNDYFKGNLVEPVNDIIAFVEDCRQKDPNKFSLNIPLNQYRTQFLNEIAYSDRISPEHHFYTITAPTGIGKTYGCLAFANSLKEKLPAGSGRIIYCLPYTSIIDQNYAEFEKIIQFNKGDAYSARPSRYLLKHHYLTEKEIVNRVDSENRSYKDYLDDQLLVESWQSAMIVTTFVQFFHTIIGNKNRMLKKFHNIVNSIVILDEVQNIDPDYYRLICECFKILGERFNIYFLLITATQPNILDKRTAISLVDSEKYMTSELFNRVKLNIDNKKKDFDTFLTEFRDYFNGDNCLLVMNTKRMAIECYQFIEEHFEEYHKYCLTTNLTPYDRELMIDEIKSFLKNKEKVIVISTQLIEAGVDISFETVYRDFGPFDSIVQVAGRCNRNGEYGILGGRMFLVDLGNPGKYKHIVHQKQCIGDILNRTEYQSIDFYNLSEQYFGHLNYEATSENLLSAISELNYDVRKKDQIPVSDFTLIEEQPKIDIFILRTKDSQRNMDRFIVLLACLKERNLSKKEKENILVELEKLKNAFKKFQISVYKHELNQYEPIIKTASPENDLYKYISYEDHLKYAYDKKVGFLKEPKMSLPNVLLY